MYGAELDALVTHIWPWSSCHDCTAINMKENPFLDDHVIEECNLLDSKGRHFNHEGLRQVQNYVRTTRIA